MKLSSRGVSFILALSVSLITGSFLSLVQESSSTGIIVGSGIAFSSSFILSYFLLEFLFFREIQRVYDLLNSIRDQKGEDNYALDRFTRSPNPFKRINEEIEEFATNKQQEIEQLKALEEFRREFLADVSHELKTPVFAAQGFIYTLLDGAVDDKKVRYKFLKKAAKSLDGLDNLVRDLLTVSQMETGAITMQKEVFDIRGLAYEVKDQLERKAEKSGSEIIIKSNRQTPYFVFADRQRIGQVFTNLMDNSIKYGKPENGKISISFKAENSRIQIEVEDNGPGIPPEHLDRVFERFYMVDKSRTKFKGKRGSGLGLAIVKHIVESHGSKVEVESQMGIGTVFTFELERGTAATKLLTPSDEEQEMA